MIKVNGKKLTLSKRKASDTLALIEYCRTLDLPDNIEPQELSGEQLKSYTLVTAQTVSDSLKATYMNMNIKRSGFWGMILNWYYDKKKTAYLPFVENGALYLLDNCEAEDLGEAFNEVISLENIKKKVVPAKVNRFLTESAKV